MKEIKLLIGDYEYDAIKNIFKKEEDFKPITESDIIIVKTLEAIISPNNLVAEDVGGEETVEDTIIQANFIGSNMTAEDDPPKT